MNKSWARPVSIWGAAPRVDALIEASKLLKTGPGRVLAKTVLDQYVEDARAMPLEEMRGLLSEHGPAPDVIAKITGQSLARVFRRLAMLPEDMSGPVGLIIVDGAGALLLRKPVMGFSTPRSGAGCTLWPVYDVLAQAARPMRRILTQGNLRLNALAVAEDIEPAGFDTPALIRGYMLLLPLEGDGGAQQTRTVGVTCQICPIDVCPARREPSILSHGVT
jgi:predicted transcriptional regulator